MIPEIRDLTIRALGLDPARYFLAADRPVPLVVEHATGAPAFALVDGRAVPYDAWRAANPPPARPAGDARGLTIQSPDGGFRAGLLVS